MTNGLMIGELARAAGVKVETVRWYEKIGLLAAPKRTESNYRSYTASDLDRLSFVRKARNLGFSIEQIQTLLSLADDSNRDCGKVDEIAHARLHDVDRKIGDLQALRQELSRVVQSCGGGTVAECRIIEALGAPNKRKP